MASLEDELVAAEHAWAAAFGARDTAALESLLAAEFRLSFVNDAREPRTVARAEWFGFLTRMTFGPIELRSIRTAIFGSVGITSVHALFRDWRIDGRPVPGEYRVVDVWIRRDGRWQAISRVSEPLESGPDFWTAAGG